MTSDVRTRLPAFVYREKTRHGRVVTYFRQGKGKRTRLPDFGSEAFAAAYQDALSGIAPFPKRAAGAGSLAWLISRYQETSDYLALSPATRKQRDNIFEHVVSGAGHIAFRSITRKDIMDGREKRAATPAQARNFLDAMRGLFSWATAAELVPVDPTLGVKNPPRPKGHGFPVWSTAEVAAYEAHWPAGTRERVWLHVLLYTGLRRGDAVRFGRQHVKDGMASIRTEKTGIEVYFDIHPQLAQTLAEGPVGDLAFIVGVEGAPLTKETFGNYFRDACRAAGINRSPHGLRKLAATTAAEASATVNELEALFGWSGGTTASIYTRSADRKRLAESGARKIRNTHSPHLNSSARTLEK